MELKTSKRGGSLCIIAFGAIEDNGRITIPASCVKEAIKKSQILKFNKYRFKMLQACFPTQDPFQKIEMILHKELK
jgi:hypothetical protein